MKTTMILTPGAIIEPVGDDVMIMTPGNTDVLRISGPAADTLRAIAVGQPIDPSTPTVLELANQGIIQTSGMSRRGLIRAGAVGVGAGIALLAMPSVAAASSSAADTTRFDVRDASRSRDQDNYTAIDIELNENGVLVTDSTIPRLTPATIILSGGTELSGQFYADDYDAFSFMNLAVPRNLVENLTHTLSFTLSDVLYEVSFTGPDW
jgi:hypothetical protein